MQNSPQGIHILMISSSAARALGQPSPSRSRSMPTAYDGSHLIKPCSHSHHSHHSHSHSYDHRYLPRPPLPHLPLHTQSPSPIGSNSTAIYDRGAPCAALRQGQTYVIINH